MLGTVLLALGALAFGVLSIALSVWVAFTLWYSLRRNAWRSVSGVVTDSRVRSNREANRLPGYHYVVGYEFTIDDHEYRANRVRFGDFRYLTRTTAERMVAAYPVGKAVVVHYDASFVPERVNDDERQPIAVLQPGFNVECLYPIATFLVALTLTLTSVLALADEVRG